MRSVWLCSRNDIIANTSVLLAALGVWLTNSQWPDLFVGLGIAVIVSAFSVSCVSRRLRNIRGA
jgi:Co/Zn/Cd efflux system component